MNPILINKLTFYVSLYRSDFSSTIYKRVDRVEPLIARGISNGAMNCN